MKCDIGKHGRCQLHQQTASAIYWTACTLSTNGDNTGRSGLQPLNSNSLWKMCRPLHMNGSNMDHCHLASWHMAHSLWPVMVWNDLDNPFGHSEIAAQLRLEPAKCVIDEEWQWFVMTKTMSQESNRNDITVMLTRIALKLIIASWIPL